ncbi:hypothetical protein NJG16_02105 [Stenotrophomonas maltophilia]|nr:hypothetical protein [Stenotrophomonas maltophilia]
MQTDYFGAYVRGELEHWGREFALHRDCEYIGHQSKNLLAVLMEHHEMPGRAQGYKPMETDPRAQAIEDIVTDIARTDVSLACVLRGYYCGSGRRKEERWEQARQLLQLMGQRPVSVRQYLSMVELGFQRVRGRLEGSAMVA